MLADHFCVCAVFVWFCYRGNAGFLKCVCKASLLINFWKNFWRIDRSVVGPFHLWSIHFYMWYFYNGFQAESARRPFKRVFVVPCSSLVFLSIFPTGFQSLIGFQRQVCWGLTPLQDLGVRVPDVELKPLASQGKDSYLGDHSWLWITSAGVWFFLWWDHLLPLLPVLMLSVHAFCGSCVHPVFRSLSEELIT